MSKALRPQPDSIIAEYYDTVPEEHRLAQSWSLLEALRTRELIERYAPVGLYGLEGPGWILSDVPARLEDPQRRTDLLRVARLLESEPLMLGISAHLLVVARRT